MDFNLTDEEIKFLKSFHKKVKDRRIADRVKCVAALAQGFSFDDIANILYIKYSNYNNFFIYFYKKISYFYKKYVLNIEKNILTVSCINANTVKFY